MNCSSGIVGGGEVVGGLIEVVTVGVVARRRSNSR